MIKALLWKDYRVNFWLLVFAIVLLIAPPVCAVSYKLHGELTASVAPTWADQLAGAVPFSLAAQLVPIVMLGGCAFASERADRSAEFLAYLPASRWEKVVSKAAVGIGIGLFVWGVNLTIAYVVAPQCGTVTPGLVESCDTLFSRLTPTAVMLFGVAWLGSSFMSSHTFATALGIAAPIALLSVLEAWRYFLASPGFELGFWYMALSWPLGVAAFVAGTVYYLRRVEP
jgi:ABC-type transport system involved in multi-copper enzyme maturation permease subunit